MNMKQTVMCIRCLNRKAITWTGHVLTMDKQRQRILAGWCRYCRKHEFAFHGQYLACMKEGRMKADKPTPDARKGQIVAGQPAHRYNSKQRAGILLEVKPNGKESR